MAEETPETQEGNGLSRRDLLAKAGAVGVGAVAAGSLAGGATAATKYSFATPKIRQRRAARLRARVRPGGRRAVRDGARSGPLGQGAHLRLAGRVRQGAEHQAGARDVVEVRGQEVDALQPAQGRQVPQRQGADGGRRRLLRQEHEEPASPRQPHGRRERAGDDSQRGGRLEVRRAVEPVGAGRPHRRLLRLAALRADRPGGALRPDQREPERDRHRSVQDGRLQPARPRRARAERELLEDRPAVHGRDDVEGDDRRAGSRRRPAGRRDRRGDALRRRGPVAPEREQPAGAEQPQRGLPRAADDAEAGPERAVGRSARAAGGQLRDQPDADHRERLQRRGGVHVVRPAGLRPLAARRTPS